MDENIAQEERILDMFEPNVLLPEQFYGRRPNIEQDPGKRLMLAILKDGVECFQKYIFAQNKQDRELFLDAETWIFEDSDWFFSFSNICEALDFDPQYLREGLRRWKEQQLRDKSFKPKHAHRRNGNGRRKIK